MKGIIQEKRKSLPLHYVWFFKKDLEYQKLPKHIKFEKQFVIKLFQNI